MLTCPMLMVIKDSTISSLPKAIQKVRVPSVRKIGNRLVSLREPGQGSQSLHHQENNGR